MVEVQALLGHRELLLGKMASPCPAPRHLAGQGEPWSIKARERSYPISPWTTSHQGVPGPQVLPKATQREGEARSRGQPHKST